MKTKIFKFFIALVGGIAVLMTSCKTEEARGNETKAMAASVKVEASPKTYRQLTKDFSNYWYKGKAEITSYELTQARYGELRPGNAVLVFVTEDFLPKIQVKADQRNPDNVPVLKLNKTKKFLTGIYPYSIMTSTFYPVKEKKHAIKVSNSVQEWCGHVYAQINNKEAFEITAHSYFQSEADQKLTLQKNILEDELWTQIRVNPEELPIGNFNIVPSLEFIRLKHQQFKAYQATTSLKNNTNTSVYTIQYQKLGRTLAIEFSNTFPFTIEGWEETTSYGYNTSARKKKQILSAYWQKNSNKDVHLRDSLGI